MTQKNREPSRRIEVRPAEANDFAQWQTLWQSYLKFCETNLPNDITELTWQRILAPTDATQAWVGVVEEHVAGFAICLVHTATWKRTPVCYLEDLFVSKDYRGYGVGRALLDHLVAHANKSGWSRLYWHTKSDNAAARQLYDSYIEADNLVRYSIALDSDEDSKN